MSKVFNFSNEETEHINAQVKELKDNDQKESIAILQAFENYRSTLHIINTKQYYPEEMKAVMQIIEFQELMCEKIYLDIRAKYGLDSLEKKAKEALVVEAH